MIDQFSQNENKKKKTNRKIIILVVSLLIVYGLVSLLMVVKSIPEVPRMQKVAEQFIDNIKNKELQSANNLLINSTNKQEVLTKLSQSIDGFGGIKEYKITNQGVKSKGLKIYGNFGGQILYENGKILPFMISVTKENGEYKISNSSFTLDLQEKSY